MKSSSMKTNHGRNSTIDALRLFAAFLVVFIHSGIHGLDGRVGALGTFILVFARLAVPFFFVVSGYFLYSDNYKKQTARVCKSINKLINIFILSSILYFIFFGWYFGSYSFTANLVTPMSLFNMIIFNHPIYNEALWFILALLGANGIVYLNARFLQKDGLILISSAILYTASLLVSNYSQILHIEPIDVTYYRNFLGEGILFVMIGYMCAKYSSYLSRLNTKMLVKYTVICLLFYILEFYTIRNHTQSIADIYFSLPFVTFLMTVWAIRYPSLLKNTPIPDLGASVALYIYILHIIFLYSLEVLFSKIGIDGDSHMFAVVRLFSAFILSLALGYLYIKMKALLKSKLAIIYSRIE